MIINLHVFLYLNTGSGSPNPWQTPPLFPASSHVRRLPGAALEGEPHQRQQGVLPAPGPGERSGQNGSGGAVGRAVGTRSSVKILDQLFGWSAFFWGRAFWVMKDPRSLYCSFNSWSLRIRPFKNGWSWTPKYHLVMDPF